MGQGLFRPSPRVSVSAAACFNANIVFCPLCRNPTPPETIKAVSPFGLTAVLILS